MTVNPVTVHARSTIGEAARILDRLSIRHLPVVDDSGEVIGMLSDRDLRGAPAAADEDFAPSTPPASARVVDLMSSDVITASADDDLAVVARLMVDSNIGAVPIVDNDGILVGIVSYVDILRSIAGGADETREPPDSEKAATIKLPRAKRRAR